MLRLAKALFLCLVVAGCTTITSPTEVPTPGAAGSLPPVSELFPEPLNPDQGDVPAFEETTPITGNLSLGTPGDAVTSTVGPAGGTVETAGLRMELAPGALTNDTSISVSATPITAADYDGTVTPITPLYSVEPGDVTLHQLATVTLAADVPAGAAALMFQYDDTAGKLTPVAPLSADVKGLTFAITHFAPLFGALVDSAQLPAIADSGFRPGQDDWQFTNWGSYVYAGHCQGMSISAIWYYTTQHKGAGAPQLNGLHDNNGAAQKTPDFQLDDSDAYRFTGVVQKDPVANPTAYAYAKLALFDADNRLTYASLRAAIALTGEPQLIHIKAADGSYHAIIVYRVTPERLFVADPNYPGRLRTIRYDAATGKLATYQSGDTAAEITNYTQFAYVPWRARESEAALAADWAALTAGTSGDGLYPAYTLSVRTAGTNESWVELSDGYRTDAAAITVAVTLPQKVSYYAYRGTKLLPPTGDIALDEGVNELGFNIVGEVVNNNVVPPEVAWKYIDFQRFNVFRGPEPTPPSSFEESPAPPPDATAQPGAGEWVLQELIPVPAQDPDSDCYFGNQVALGDGGFTSVGSWKDDGCVSGGPYYSGSITGTCSWTAPPSYLKVGETIALTMECQSSANQTGGGRFGGGQGWMVLTLNPPPDNLGGRMSWSQKILGDVSSGGWSGDLPKSDSKSGSIEIPAGSQDDILVIYASVGGPGGDGQFIYKYVYGGADQVPPRATVAPISPATPLPLQTATPVITTPTPTPEPTPVPVLTPEPPATVPPGAEPQEMYTNLSLGVANNGATAPTTFTITSAWLVTEIIDYHWNDGKGAKQTGTIALLGPGGTTYGPWQVDGQPGCCGVQDAYWVVNPNVVIPAGTYTVIDSNPETWSQNSETGGAGMSWGKGIPMP